MIGMRRREGDNHITTRAASVLLFGWTRIESFAIQVVVAVATDVSAIVEHQRTGNRNNNEQQHRRLFSIGFPVGLSVLTVADPTSGVKRQLLPREDALLLQRGCLAMLAASFARLLVFSSTITDVCELCFCRNGMVGVTKSRPKNLHPQDSENVSSSS